MNEQERARGPAPQNPRSPRGATAFGDPRTRPDMARTPPTLGLILLLLLAALSPLAAEEGESRTL